MKQVDVCAYFGRLLALIMAVLLCIRVLKRHIRKNANAKAGKLL